MPMQQRRNEANNASLWISKREINKFIRKRRDRKQILKSSEFATKYQEPSGKVFHKKSQSAMEYLMTYGWAILIIAIVLVAFFSLNLFNPYTFSPKASPGSCQILRPNGPGSNLFVSAVGPTCTTNEIPQYVAQFNGASSTISVTEISAYAITGSITEAAWVKFNSVDTSINSGIVTPDISNTYPLLFLQDGSGVISYSILTAAGINGIGDATPTPKQWYFVVGRYNLATGNLSVCANNTCHSTPYTPGATQTSYGAGWTFGSFPIQNTYSDAQMADVQIYNTSLSTSAINTLYAEGIGGAPVDIQNLVGWWPLNGNSNDYSGNGNNGVPVNVVFISNWENGYTAP